LRSAAVPGRFNNTYIQLSYHNLWIPFRKEKAKSEKHDKILTVPGELPAGLDFFKYAQNNSGKRKAEGKQDHSREKRRKVERDSCDKEHGMDTAKDVPMIQDVPRRAAQRVATKGARVPPPINSFDDLRKYSIPSHLYTNLASSGYKDPTGIQSYCIPVLLQVRSLIFSTYLYPEWFRIEI